MKENDKRKTRSRDKSGTFSAYEKTEKNASLVKGFAAVGLPHEQIATYLQIDKVTLYAHFREELDNGMIEANSQVAKTLFNKAISGDTASLIFWAKVRMGWSEKVIHANDPDNPMPAAVEVVFVKNTSQDS
jgi:hypothetical protein